MKKYMLIVLAIFCTHFTYAQGADIQKVIDITKKAIFDAATELKASNLPKLSKVVIDLETEAELSADGSVKLYVVSANGQVSRKNTQKISIELKPDFGSSIDISGVKDLGKQLKNLIVQASQGIAKANEGRVPMIVEKVEIVVGISVSKGGGGDVGFDIGVVSLGVGADVTKGEGHSVTLTFGK